ncbi:sugar O-acyltransferase, sialic acid O-acetyltransferase NeuD family [Pasteurella testudinis DSM 23072]|uniref:Sugar O-acyltransferase, sialic acid O-acetyltransferase NeuD family n=1 Tax=Pasteurella testudinis DSM 23072 TaxID=1122938 RepID=A0A1W1V9D8_9PAST|nr:acetyltransferase [Pasteurella testudinis]SMB89883.1 sugar O-acyltransferase, sialic acid O-acetyltransferase NeuD family [Pasteurella testudinis DSM 23072]SUB52109.1 acyl-[acyl-carrier-protein]--UDP-N-acetylglucosamine O-acyltransferase [Pasteurella testudinis]
MREKLIIIGAGGFAKSVLDSLDLNRYDVVGFVDSFKDIGTSYLGYCVLANDIKSLKDKENYKYFIAIGNNRYRYEKYQILKEYGLETITVVDSTAFVSHMAKIGVGVYIGKLVIVNSCSVIGDNTIVNTKALVEHGNRIGNHCNISTNVTLNGDVSVGDFSFIGSSCVTNGQITIGTNALIGSGSVIIRNVPDNVVVAGVPAKYLRDNHE